MEVEQVSLEELEKNYHRVFTIKLRNYENFNFLGSCRKTEKFGIPTIIVASSSFVKI